jgi:hypothetical protein
MSEKKERKIADICVCCLDVRFVYAVRVAAQNHYGGVTCGREGSGNVMFPTIMNQPQ